MLKLILTLAIILQLAATPDQQLQKDRHEFVRIGNHANELGLGDYVVLKALADEAQAKSSVADFKQAGIPEAKYGFVTLKKSWYVVVGPFVELDKARETRSNLLAKVKPEDCWLLTVHEGPK